MARKTNEDLAREVMNGSWGNGQERKDRLTSAGYDYAAVQGIVNNMVNGYTTVGGDSAGYGNSGNSGNYGGGQSYSYSSTKAPTYISRYQSQIDSLLNDILNRPAFSYDYHSDPTYQQYEEAYTRNGSRAMEDALGVLSSRTGGLASSYAATAAQQQYNNYMNELSDIIPELEQLAYSMYLQEGNSMRDNLSILQALESQAYNRYRDELADYYSSLSMSGGRGNGGGDNVDYLANAQNAVLDAAKAGLDFGNKFNPAYIQKQNYKEFEGTLKNMEARGASDREIYGYIQNIRDDLKSAVGAGNYQELIKRYGG